MLFLTDIFSDGIKATSGANSIKVNPRVTIFLLISTPGLIGKILWPFPLKVLEIGFDFRHVFFDIA